MVNEHSKYYDTNRHIHTLIEPHIKKKLLTYGNGALNSGIENLIDIVESKRVRINILTELILND